MRNSYNIRQDPQGTWTVFNTTTGLTAYVDSKLQHRLDSDEAYAIVSQLNRMGGMKSHARVGTHAAPTATYPLQRDRLPPSHMIGSR